VRMHAFDVTPLDPPKGREALGTRDFRFGEWLPDWETSEVPYSRRLKVSQSGSHPPTNLKSWGSRGPSAPGGVEGQSPRLSFP